MTSLDKELMNKVESNSPKLFKALKKVLKIKDEEILIITDEGQEGKRISAMLGYGYYHATKNNGFNPKIIYQGIKKGFMHAEEQVVKALNELKENSVIIIVTSNKLGRFGDKKSFRKFCKEKGHKFTSATGLGEANTTHFDNFIEAINVNYARLRKKSISLKNKLDKAKIIQIKTEAGTDLTFNVSDMKAIANVGDYFEKGTGGNVPAGEVYIPPKGYYGVNGIAVIDGSIRTINGGILLDEPLILHIKDGKIIKIEGKNAKELDDTLVSYENRAQYPYRIRHIGELGIGINPRAVLTGSTIMDEKVLGTAHIGIGSNYWFGGEIKTIFHGDQVFKDPIIFIDGKKLRL